MSHNNLPRVVYPSMITKDRIFRCRFNKQLRVIESMCISFAYIMHCTTIFVFSVHKLNGSVSLTWTDKMITLSWHVTSWYIMCDMFWHDNRKWDISLSIYCTTESQLKLCAFFSLDCITILIYSVHYSIYQLDIGYSVATFYIKLFYIQLESYV